MTDEELTAFWSDDLDPQSKEAVEQMQMMINCMGYDSMEDFMSIMMPMMDMDVEAEIDLETELE